MKAWSVKQIGKRIIIQDGVRELAEINSDNYKVGDQLTEVYMMALAPEMLEVINEYRRLASSASIYDESQRLLILDKMDAIVRKVKGEE